MKHIICALSLMFVVNAKADIDASSDDGRGKATPAEITRSHSCFRELEDEGCGNPGENPKEFKSCLAGTYSKLSDDCQKMMSNLYGTK
jgi:hypothetical protein